MTPSLESSLIRRLNEARDRFDFAQFMEEFEVDNDQAAQIAESVFRRICNVVFADGVLTEYEQDVLDRIGKQLNIGVDLCTRITREESRGVRQVEEQEAPINVAAIPEDRQQLRKLRASLRGEAKDEEEHGRAHSVFALIRRRGGRVELDDNDVAVAVDLQGCQAFSDEDVHCLQRLPGLQRLFIGDTTVSDIGLARIGEIHSLKSLVLYGERPNPSITNACMKYVSQLHDLEILNLYGTRVDDDGLKHISHLDKLRLLILPGPATDQGLQHLTQLKNLHAMEVTGSKVTEEGMAYIQSRLPNCRVFDMSAAEQGAEHRETQSSPEVELSAEPPFEIDNRPSPQGKDIDVLLPRQVGDYARASIRRGADIRHPIYADYRCGESGIFVELGICDNEVDARQGVVTARAETTEADRIIHAWRIGTDPSFLLESSPGSGAFMAWTRGCYYFSAHARGGQQDLERFVKAFPY